MFNFVFISSTNIQYSEHKYFYFILQNKCCFLHKTINLLHRGSSSQRNVSVGFLSNKKVENHLYTSMWAFFSLQKLNCLKSTFIFCSCVSQWVIQVLHQTMTLDFYFWEESFTNICASITCVTKIDFRYCIINVLFRCYIEFQLLPTAEFLV